MEYVKIYYNKECWCVSIVYIVNNLIVVDFMYDIFNRSKGVFWRGNEIYG